VITELSKYEFYANSDNDHLPDHIQLAGILGYNQAKMNKILKELFNQIIENLYENPIMINNVIHHLHIHPYFESEDQKNKEWVKDQWYKAITVSIILPVTSRIGDYIKLPFLQMHPGFSTEDKYDSGYVHEVRHYIYGTTQNISVYIYPFKNFYYKWDEMKKEFDDNKRWLARLGHGEVY
jgi:aromatic ring-cleaving dioxygenase